MKLVCTGNYSWLYYYDGHDFKGKILINRDTVVNINSEGRLCISNQGIKKKKRTFAFESNGE